MSFQKRDSKEMYDVKISSDSTDLMNLFLPQSLESASWRGEGVD